MRPILVTLAAAVTLFSCSPGEPVIIVGSKNFAENVFLAELIAQQIEREAGYQVDRRFNLGGTFLCHQALKVGELDIYPEYTGTALIAILEQPVERDPDTVMRAVSEAYRQRFGAEWLRAFGFNNTFAILVRGDEPESLRTLSDLAAVSERYRIGYNFEFDERKDGYRGMAETYGLRFASEPVNMDLSLVYRALAARRIDVAVGYSTHGMIAGLGLRMLEDDRRYFPPYDAAPVVRRETLRRFPKLREALEKLGGAISEPKMQEINRRLDIGQEQVEAVAREFLESL